MIAFHFAHTNLGDSGFTEFALMRRVVAFLVPLLSVGMAVAITKKVARQVAEKRVDESIQVLGVGVVVSLLGTVALAFAIFLVPRQISFLFTGSDDYVQLLWPLVPLVGGSILVVCVSTYCRGRMWIGFSNALQLVCVGIIPTVLLVCVYDVRSFLWLWGGAVCVVSGLATIVVYLTAARSALWPSRDTASCLLRIGLPRVPGDLAYYGLFTMPAIVAAHHGGLQAGGDIAYAIAWLTLVGQIVTPISTLLLPEASYLLHTGEAALLRRRVGKLVRYSITITTFLVVVLIYWGPEIITFHLGSCRPSLLHAVRVLLVAAIPLNLFICLRSVIDAGESRAVSPRLCLIAFASFCLALLPFSRLGLAEPALYSLLLATCILAALSVATTCHVFYKHLRLTNDLRHSTPIASVGG